VTTPTGRQKHQLDDTEIIARILGGETALYEILIRRSNPYLYRIGRSYRFGHEDSQDLMQDTFIDAFSSLPKFEGRSSFTTWIMRIMIYNCQRKLQKWSVKSIVSSDVSDEAVPLFSSDRQTDTGKAIMNKELSIVIEKALHRIPLDYRITFTLREVNGMSVADTADVLGITETNVKVRLNRAKAMLRKEIEKSYSPEEIFEFNLIYCDALTERVMAMIIPNMER